MSNFIRLWDPQTPELGRWTYADLENDVSLFIGYNPHQETAEKTTGDPNAAIIKALCHVYVQIMPTEALPELTKSLKRILDFYRPEPVRLMVSATPAREARARVGERYVRPKFQLEE